MLQAPTLSLVAVVLAGVQEVLRLQDEADETDDETDAEPTTRNVYDRADYRSSAWWFMLRNGACRDPESRQYKVFRRRFAVTFERFKEIVEKTRSWGIFSEKKDRYGRPCVPLELKILGALRYLSKGSSFDAIAELSGMAEQTAHSFFHQFWYHFVLEYKDIWIKYPSTAAEAQPITDHYARLGLPGAVGSVDCTHVWWAMCPASKTQLYTNGKNKVPTVAFECVVSPTGRCLYVSQGHPGTRSDKTIVKTNDYVQRVLRREILQDVTFDLLTDTAGEHITCTGGWFITDNGYTKVRSMQCPIKSPSTFKEYDWSARLESTRKDVECFFGRLKTRFQLLWTRINFRRQVSKVETVFHAACILHNMLHHDDGFDDDWVACGEEDQDVVDALRALRVRRRMEQDGAQAQEVHGQEEQRILHRAGAGAEDEDGDDEDRDIGFFRFRTQLINHFTHREARMENVWLRRQPSINN